jgi:hypothetical protein
VSDVLPAEICYLLLLPLRFTPPAGQARLLPTPPQKDAPYFFDLDIEFSAMGERRIELEGIPVTLRFQVLDEQVWLAECRYRLADLMDEAALSQRQAIQNRLKENMKQETGYTGAFVEEYTIVLLRQVEPTPDEFVNNHALLLARWLRVLPKPLSEIEVNKILDSRTRYSQSDLTVVDWGGALIIAEEGDFQSDIELLKIGNYQLLRYRLLDRAIERNLQSLRRLLTSTRLLWLPSESRTVQKIVEQRLTLLLDFEKIDQSLLLIGDWYSAQVYRLIVSQFFLDNWKGVVRLKLDSQAAIDEIIRQNLAFSWRRLLDMVQLVGWLILLIGYFVLFFVNLGG